MVSSRSGLPPGDGHPVVIFPGLAADSLSTRPLRQLCEQLGYATYDWGRGQNTGPEGDPESWFDELALDVRALIRPHAAPASLIGWSLGGIYAREVAKRLGDAARQVITLGTPFAGTPDETNAVWLYRLLNGAQPPAEPSLVQRVARAPAVPTTSIYTRSDGVVAWLACIQPGSNAHVDNIEVSGSHCGLGWNSEVLEIVAHKLKLHGRARGGRRAAKQAKRGSGRR
jgi:pimeloyl-ACP methyl ester carboxylesterase